MRSLLVAPVFSASLLSGGGQRTFHVYRTLANLGSVDLMLISEEGFDDAQALAEARDAYRNVSEIIVCRSTAQNLPPRHVGGVVEHCAYAARRLHRALEPRSHFYRPTAQAVRAFVSLQERRAYDVVVARYLQYAALSGALEQKLVPVLVDLDDIDEAVLESRLQAQTTSLPRKLLLWHHAWQVRRIAHRLRLRCRHVFTVSSNDLARVGHSSSSILPNIPVMRDDAASANPQANGSSPVVLFVGSHAHRVNREGVLDFVKRCWPAIRARVPHASFRIVGSAGWEAERDGLEKIAGVRVVGTVERLDEEYASAACCVVPVFEGSGTKIKVLEALLFGRPVVAAAHSTRGYDELVGKGLIRVEDDSQMIEACAGLLGEPSSRTSIASAGQRFVREHYSFDAFAKALGRGLEASGILPRSTQRTDETESASRLYPP